MKQYLALLLPAFGVTVTAVPVAMVIDHLGRGATVLRALAVLPFWLLYTVLFALPFLLPGAALALLLRGIGGEWWRSPGGRLLYTVLSAGIAFALVAWPFPSYAGVAAAAGGTAAWLAASPDWQPRWRAALVVGTGLTAGVTLGLAFY